MGMIYKTITIALTISALIFSCSNQGTSVQDHGKSIMISGKVAFPQQHGVIILTKFLENSLENVDSVTISDDGTYELRVNVPAPNFYRLDFYQKQSVDVILNDQDVVINLDGDSPEGAKEVIGSWDTELFETLVKQSQEMELEIALLNQQFMQARQAGDDQIATQVQSKYMDLSSSHEKEFKTLIWDMGESVAAIYGLEFLAQRNLLSLDEQYPFIDSLNRKFEGFNAPVVDNFRLKAARLGQLAVGMPAPEISLPNPDGQIVSLSSLRGRVVMIDFWAAWCRPCRMENPNVVRLYKKYNSQGFEVFGVSLDRQREAWVEAIETDGLIWNQVSDLKFWDSEVTRSYDIKAIPLTYLLDQDGIIIGKNLRGQSLERKLDEIFG